MDEAQLERLPSALDHVAAPAPAVPDEPTFGLDQLLRALRADLVAANANPGTDDPILEVGSVELEVAFTLEATSETGGGLSFKVFGIGVEGGGKGFRDGPTRTR